METYFDMGFMYSKMVKKNGKKKKKNTCIFQKNNNDLIIRAKKMCFYKSLIMSKLINPKICYLLTAVRLRQMLIF